MSSSHLSTLVLLPVQPWLSKNRVLRNESLNRFWQKRELFLKRIVKCNETWVPHYTPKSKMAYKEWQRKMKHSMGRPKPVSRQEVLAKFFLLNGSFTYWLPTRESIGNPLNTPTVRFIPLWIVFGWALERNTGWTTVWKRSSYQGLCAQLAHASNSKLVLRMDL